MGSPVAADDVVLRIRADATGAGDGMSWETAFADLQQGLEAAAPIAKGGNNVQLWLAQGMYEPSARTEPDEPFSATFRMLNRVTIYGGFAGYEEFLHERDHTTRLSVLTGRGMAWHVVTAIGTDATAALDGVTVQEGRGGPGFPVENHQGAGIFVVNASPMIVNCVIRANLVVRSNARGAGAYVQGGAPSFIGCTFMENTSEAGDGAAIATLGANPVLSGCTFISNFAEFGGGALGGAGFVADDCIFVLNGSAGGGALFGSGTFRDCEFRMNTGEQSGGAAFDTAGSSFVQCRFVDNLGGFDGGGVGAAGSSAFVNCLFLRNGTFGLGSAVSDGGLFANCCFNTNVGGPAVFAFGPAPVIINSTFFNNDGGGADYAGNGALTVANSVFWSNHRKGVVDESAQINRRAGDIVVNYTFIHALTGALGGAGNLGGADSPDPLLHNPEGEDGVRGTEDDELGLGPGSPCIDAGNNGALPPDAHDLDADGDTEEQLPLDRALAARRVDDPKADDRGKGTAPIVDMGAFERQLPPHCPGDWNFDSVIDSRDFFDFLVLFFAGSADFNHDGVTDVNDFFEYLMAFFAGCD